MNTVKDKVSMLLGYYWELPKVTMLFRQEDADNRHNRRRRKALKRKNKNP